MYSIAALISSDSTQYELTEEELREIIPQLQQLTNKYKRAERVQKALFDISELASSVSHLNRLYTAIHEIIADFMNADNVFAFHITKIRELQHLLRFINDRDKAVWCTNKAG